MNPKPIIRKVILLTLLALALITAFCEPSPDNTRWYLSLFLSKITAVASGLLYRYLLRRWRKSEDFKMP